MLRRFKELDDLLRGEKTRPQRLVESGLGADVRSLALMIVVLCLVYGACMGSFSLLKETGPGVGASDRYLQWFASAIKTPVLFFLTLLITLPSLYVFNALVGSRLKLATLVQLLVASLAVNTAVLASFGPIVAFFSVSTNSYPFIKLLNVVAFSVAGILGLMFLLQTLHRLSTATDVESRVPSTNRPAPAAAGHLGVAQVEVDAQEQVDEAAASSSPLDTPSGQVLSGHTRTVFRCWVVLFALVGAQLGWVLRPFIGDPNLPFSWIRSRQSNFFTDVLNALSTLLTGG